MVMKILLYLLITIVLISGCTQKEEEKIVLKAADNQSQDYPTVQGLIKIGDLLKVWTKGRITVQVYSGGQLGPEKETIEQTQIGAIDINRVSVGHISQVVPEMNVLALPYIFRSEGHAFKVYDGEVGKKLLAACESHDLVGLGFYDAGQRSFYNTKKPVKTIDDLVGMKIRVMGADIFVDMVKALGASAAPMAFEEVYTALQTGVIDGAENNFPSYISKGHYESAKYYTLDEHLRVPEIIVFSKKTWNKLSADDKNLVQKAAKESIPHQRALWKKKVTDSIIKAEAFGCEIITNIDKDPFIKAMEPVYEKYAPTLLKWINDIQQVK